LIHRRGSSKSPALAGFPLQTNNFQLTTIIVGLGHPVLVPRVRGKREV
jgi:hypothetical protein